MTSLVEYQHIKMATSSDKVPTLTAKQTQSTIAAQKRRKKNIRNLYLPPNKPFWPVIRCDEESGLSVILQDLLPAAKAEPKESRRRFANESIPKETKGGKKKAKKETGIPDNGNAPYADTRKQMRGYLFVGVNAVARAVEKNKASGVLLGSDTDPVILNQHLATLCATHGVPVLAVPSLRTTTQMNLGFSCIALGLKKIVAESPDNHFHKLYVAIQKLSEMYQPPSLIQKILLSHLKTAKQEHVSEQPKKTGTSSSSSQKSVENFKPSEGLYLYRTSKKTRAFVPGVVQDMETQNKSPQREAVDFMTLGSSESDENEGVAPLGISSVLISKKRRFPATRYVPFNYKRVKNNENKRKNK